ncbi:MAG: PDZ domain-containing protein, partial [Planctomycetota bacterium]
EENAPAVLAEILEKGPDLEAVRDALALGIDPRPSPERAAKMQAGWSAWEAEDSDGVTRPYQLYVPASVAEGSAMSALVVHLHGSVARADFGTGLGSPNASGYASLLWPELAERQGYVIAAPLGREDCVWWSDAGARHVRAVVRDVRRSLKVPDRSIFASGFSDGASGCYYLAMAAPDPFAGFIALNGHPAVAASASGKQLYLRNLRSSELVAAATQEDSLYPSRTVFPHLERAIRSGANVHFLSYPEINHQPLYFSEQSALLTNFIENKKRKDDALEQRWLTSTADLGSVRRLRVLELGEGERDGAALEPHNVMTEAGRVSLGVRPSAQSTLIAEVFEGSAAARSGMLAGDRIVRFEGQAIDGLRGLRRALREKSYGKSFQIHVQRGEEEIELSGSFGPFVSEPIYLRKDPTAHVDIQIKLSAAGGPRIEVSSFRVRRFELGLPSAVGESSKLRARINGSEEELLVKERSVRELLTSFSVTGDAESLSAHYVDVRIE